MYFIVSGRLTVAGIVGFLRWQHTSNGVGVFWMRFDVDMVAMAMIQQQFTLTLYIGPISIFLWTIFYLIIDGHLAQALVYTPISSAG
jgi:hypothetical protein